MATPRLPSTREEAGDIAKVVRKVTAYWRAGRNSRRKQPGRGRYRSEALDEAAKKAKMSVTKLRKARQFAEGYDESQLQALIKLLEEHKPRFGTSHIGILVTVPADRRPAIQRACIEEGWSKARLEDEAKKGKEPSGGGRKRRVPGDVPLACVQLDEMADSWLRWHSVAAPEAGKGVLAKMAKKVRTLVSEVATGMESLRKALASVRKAARRAAAKKAASGPVGG